MPDFYLEQAFAAPLTPAAERSLLQRLAVCADAHQARWRDCLVDGERQRLVCRVEAEDLQTARSAALCSGFTPATWLSTVPGTSTTVTGNDTRAGLVDVLAECRRDTAAAALEVAQVRHVCTWCLGALRVEPGPMVMSADGRRVLAFFRAPDAEAVRNAYRRGDLPFDRVVPLRRIGQSSPT